MGRMASSHSDNFSNFETMESIQTKKLVNIVELLIKTLGIPVTKTSIREELEFHPNKKSLLSISQALTKWNISNASYKVSPGELLNVPSPFVTNFNQGNLDFLLVTKLTDREVHYFDCFLQLHITTFDKFCRYFSGVVLVSEADEDSGEKNYKLNRIREKINWLKRILFLPVFLAFLFVLLYFFSGYFEQFNLTIMALTFSKITGFAVSLQLLSLQLGHQTRFSKKLCEGNRVSCTDIINSRAAKLFGGLVSWAEVGLLYFAFTFLTLVLNSSSTPILALLSILSVACLTYTIYSIVYQAFVVKKWCLLCCCIQLILWIEAILLLKYFEWSSLPSIASVEIAKIFLCAIAILLLYFFVKPLYISKLESKNLKEKVNKFLYNEQLFYELLTRQRKRNSPEESYSIILGNRESSNVITVVLSPFCDHCADMYKEIQEWLLIEPDVQFRILFRPATYPENLKKDVLQHLMSIYEDSIYPIKEALDLWFTTRDYYRWSKKYPIASSGDLMVNLIESQNRWCQQEDVQGVPTILINGYEIPEPYDINTVKHFMN